MAQPTNTFDQYSGVGNREDLSDIIFNISPVETPFLSSIKRGKSTGHNHEWQTEALASPDLANARIDGNDAVGGAITPTTRLGNYNQISDKTIVISGRQESVKKAGRKSELAHQLMNKGKELKRDMEAILTNPQAKAAGNSTTASTAASYQSWISNSNRGVGGADSATLDGAAVPTAGTNRAFTEALLKDVIQQCWSNGGNPDMVLVSGTQKQAASAFTGIATQYNTVGVTGKNAIVAAADIYVSDFGVLKIVPSRYVAATDALVIDTDYWKFATLRPLQHKPLAKTGDSEKRQMLVDYTLEACNPLASGVVADLA